MPKSQLKHLKFEEIAALPQDAAGRKMIASVPLFDPRSTVEEVRKTLEAEIHTIDTINYIYVVDEWGKFIGVLSLKDMYRLPPQHTMGEVCKREGLVSVHTIDHQERVAYLALRHNIKAVPVVDDDHHFLGVIPSDVILRILYKEVHEDLLRLVGIRHGSATFDNVFELSIWQSFKHRFPWLSIGLIGGVAAASLIEFFEGTLRESIILAGFIPLVVYMGDAVGTQTQTFIIRDLAMDRKLKFMPYFTRQFIISTYLAFVYGIAIYAFCMVRYGDARIAYTLGLALFAAVVSSVISGALFPYILSRFKTDPANAGGPLSTILQDLISIFLYFLIAGLFF